MHQGEIAPLVTCPLDHGARTVGNVVEAVVGRRGLGGLSPPPSPATRESIALALNEILHTLLELSGGRWRGTGARVELWVETTFLVIVVRFAGAALPDWLLVNWDRTQEPDIPAAARACGWSWLLVREGLDSVDHTCRDGAQMLFLEKRLRS